ncbi:MAG: hypothetical protein WC613_06045 [Candidatus Aenigmatarchaeota archaeon]
MPGKSKIVSLHKGINLPGFRVFYNYKPLKKSNIRLVQNRISYFIDLYRDGIITKEEILMRIDGCRED